MIPQLKACTIIGLTLSLAPMVSVAQDYPNKPITFYVSYAAGATTDITARALARAAEGLLGVPITVDNKGGGGGTVAAGLLVTARPAAAAAVQNIAQRAATDAGAAGPVLAAEGVAGAAVVVVGLQVAADAPTACVTGAAAIADLTAVTLVGGEIDASAIDAHEPLGAGAAIALVDRHRASDRAGAGAALLIPPAGMPARPAVGNRADRRRTLASRQPADRDRRRQPAERRPSPDPQRPRPRQSVESPAIHRRLPCRRV